MMNQYRVVLKLFNSRYTSDYVQAMDEKQARHNAFKYCITMYKNARPEFIRVELVKKMWKFKNQWV